MEPAPGGSPSDGRARHGPADARRQASPHTPTLHASRLSGCSRVHLPAPDALAPGTASWATALLPYPWHPKHRVVTVHASFPRYASHLDREVGAMTLALSMHRWAMYGGGEDLRRVTGPLVDWLLAGADALQADTGYITLDAVDASNDFSPWERVTGCSPGLRDVTSTLWGYGWGTLLSAKHLERVGGLQRLEDAGLGVEALSGGRAWVRLNGDIAALEPSAVVALRAVLRPALPVGTSTVEEYYAQPANEYAPVIERYVV